MKKAFSFTIPILALFVIACITQSCKQVKDQVYVLEMNDLMFTTNPQNTTGPMVLVDTVVAAGLVQYMEDNGVSLDHVKSVKLKSFTLKTDPVFSPDANFNSFVSGSAYMKAGSLSEQLFATKSPVPDNVKELSFDSNGSELKEYLKNNELQIILRGENDATLPETNYIMDMSFEVTYDIL
jgi:hypothetical protein